MNEQMESLRHAGKSAVVTAVAVIGVLVASPALAADDCRPLTRNEWRTRCVADREAVRDALSDVQRARSFRDVGSAGAACRVLAASSGGCAEGRSQLMALLLSVGDGRLRATCCVRTGGETLQLVEVIRRADRALVEGAEGDECARIALALASVNDGSNVVACDGSDDDRGSGGDAAHGGHAGPGAAIGRGHDEHGRGRGVGHERHHADGNHDEDTWAERCCDPRSAAAWARACRLGGADASTVAELDDEVRSDAGDRACDALQSDGSACGRARREIVAARVNLRAGRLGPDCTLVDGRSAGDVLRRATTLWRTGDCEAAADLARRLNDGPQLVDSQPCEPRRRDRASDPGDDAGDIAGEEDQLGDHGRGQGPADDVPTDAKRQDEGKDKDKDKGRGKAKGRNPRR